MARAGLSIEVKGITRLRSSLKALEEMDAPEITAGLGRIARLADSEVSRSAPGSMGGKVNTRPAKKLGATITLGEVKHPGAKAMEFGRTTYYEGYKGRAQKSGNKVKRGGQKARPFIGIKTGKQAMGRLQEPVERELRESIAAVWNRGD